MASANYRQRYDDEEGAMTARERDVADLDYDEDLQEDYHGPAELQDYHEIDDEEDYERDDGYSDDAAESAPYIVSDHTHNELPCTWCTIF